MSEYKRRRGDRRDARWVRDVPGLQGIMTHLMPNRTDCEVFLNDTFDITELLQFIEKKNAENPEYKMTFFHCFLFAVAKMIHERPVMNRFIQGRRMYERFEISLSFVCKRQYTEGAEESLMMLVPDSDCNIDGLSHRIGSYVNETRKSEHSTGGVDALMDGLVKLPRLLLMLICKVVRIMDFWGVNPKSLTDGDPNYSTVLFSNLGSIQGPNVYHHLNNYGTNSLFVTIGTIRKEERIMPDGTKSVRDVVDIGATLDERIGDGFYFIRSLKLVKHLFAHPELLELPLSQPSGFDYK